MKDLSSLLSETWAFFKHSFSTILILAVLIGLCTGTVQYITLRATEQQAANMLKNIGLDDGRLQELQQRAQQGDQAAISEYTQELQKRFQGLEQGKMTTLVVQQFIGMAKVLSWSMPLNWILMSFATLLFLILATSGEQSIALILQRGFSVLLPFLGLSLWLFARTLVWIPFVGLILILFLGPRFVAAPVIFLTENKGVFGSASESYRRTQGLWGKIVGNLFVAGLIASIVLMVVNMFLGMGGPLIGTFLRSIAGIVSVSFTSIFLAKLSMEFKG